MGVWDDMFLQDCILNELGKDKDPSGLSTEELEKTKDVYWYAKAALRNSCSLGSNEFDAQFHETYEEVKRNVLCILRQLKQCRRARKGFMEEFPEWKAVRQENIKLLKEIALSINSDRFKCNVSKLVGSSVSFAGGALSVVSAVLIPFTFGLSTPLFVAGLVTTGLGTATTVGASITEIAMLNADVKKAQEICQEDKKKFEYMKQFFKSSEELVKAIDKVIEFDLLKEILLNMEQAFKTTNDIFRKSRHSAEKLKWLVDKLVKKLLLHLSPQVSQMMIYIPIIICLIFATFFLHLTNRFLIGGIIITFRIISGLLGVGSEAVCMSSVLLKGGRALARPVAKAVARGALAGLGMALDIANIAITSIDVHKGSRSEAGKSIMDASNKMQEELDMLEKVYQQ